ncbi:hypothetical protein [Streptomyces sp. NPDC048442]|uniref:hypothetical protein n=1 Tax=Streptomyces sp. NPDC048442 TaxID=3154823 RepID=UPI0034174220
MHSIIRAAAAAVAVTAFALSGAGGAHAAGHATAYAAPVTSVAGPISPHGDTGWGSPSCPQVPVPVGCKQN